MNSSQSNPKDSTTLTGKASRSILWSMSGNMGVSAIRFISTIVLARLLAPEEFGIIGMALLFTGLITIFGNFGMAAALVQLKTVDEEFLSTAFWTNTACGVTLFLITLAISPFASIFFNDPRVQSVLALLALNFIFSYIALTHAAMLHRDLRFKEMAMVELISSVLRVVLIIVLALLGFSFWSLVWGTLFERIFKTFLIFNLYRWKPKFIFSKDRFQKLFHFGKNVYGQNFVSYFLSNIDFIIVGKLLGPQSLAFYQFAYNLPHLVLSNISLSIESVTFPMFSKIQDQKENLSLGFLKTVKFISLITFPLMGGLSVVAPDFIVTMYGSKWIAAIIPLQILCLSGAIRAVTISINPVLQAIGRPDVTLKCNIVFLPIVALLILGGAVGWGTTGVAWGMTLSSMLFLITIKIGVKFLHTTMRSFWINLWPAFFCTFFMSSVLLILIQNRFLVDFHSWARLLINVIVGFILYIVCMRIVFKNDFFEVFGFFRKMFAKSH